MHLCMIKYVIIHKSGIAFSDGADYNEGMTAVEPASTTSLTIRNIDVRLKERLRVRAARHGHSMEAELRDILRQTLTEDSAGEVNLAEAIRRRFAPFGGVELELPSRDADHEPPSFE